MNNGTEDLYDYELVKQCCRCKNILIKSNFHKDNKRKDVLYNQCKVCRKEYYMKNSIEIFQKQKVYYLENRNRVEEYELRNHDKITAQKNIYSNNKYKTDINFRLICKTRSRIRQALQR